MFFSGIFFLFTACTNPPMLEGSVTDIWNKPIADAQVKFEGSDEQPRKTDRSGKFSFPAKEGKSVFVASKKGYIHTKQNALFFPEKDPTPSPLEFKLYPEPKTEGFFAVGAENYLQIKQEKLRNKASSLKSIRGLQYQQKLTLKSKQASSFLFHTNLSKEELKQIGLQLHKLKFIEKAHFKAATGDTEVPINLWVADTSSSFIMKSLPQEKMFLIEFKEPLPPGHYAFHTHGVLTSSEKNGTAKDLQIAYPFQVKK